MDSKPLNILLLAAEVAPFAKVGGLADVAGALPKALTDLGHDARVVMPAYRMIETNPEYAVEEVLPAFPVPIREGLTLHAYVKRTWIRRPKSKGKSRDIPVYLIGQAAEENADASKPGFFQTATDSTKVYALEPEPYVFFCRAVLEMLPRLASDWTPDILHCNDWHTGLVPVFQRAFYADSPSAHKPATVFTIHNLAYQGNFPHSRYAETGLPESLYAVNGLEFYGEWSFMKGALLFSDRVNTVSENYACEIQSQEYGCGLQGLMHTLYAQNRLRGILNGIDYEEFDPATDPRIPANFSARKPAGKAKCKQDLQAELGLPQTDALVIGVVSRLADQKGLDLIHAISERMLNLPVQFVLLGTGDRFYEKFFTDLQARYPHQVHARIGFDVELAQRIYAGSDLFLMPSRFEPCGLGQLISLRYGTIPIVRATGGLADTVHDFDPEASPEGNGFVFTDYQPEALLSTVERAVAALQNASTRKTLVQRALTGDSSWERSAGRYVSLYSDALAARESDSANVVESTSKDRKKSSRKGQSS